MTVEPDDCDDVEDNPPCGILRIREDGIPGGWVVACCDDHDPLISTWDTAEDAKSELGWRLVDALGEPLDWWQEDGDWMAAHVLVGGHGCNGAPEPAAAHRWPPEAEPNDDCDGLCGGCRGRPAYDADGGCCGDCVGAWLAAGAAWSVPFDWGPRRAAAHDLRDTDCDGPDGDQDGDGARP